MMNAWDLPDELEIAGTKYKIRTDYRVILDILKAMNDPDILSPDMTEDEIKWEKCMTMLQILYIDFDDIPVQHYQEAAEKAVQFIDMGIEDDGQRRPRIMDWDQDSPIIFPAVNRVIGKEIRSTETHIHWWTFLGAYMEIGESLFSHVINIRQKKEEGKKLEKWEMEFYKKNKKMIDFRTKRAKRSEEEKDELRELLGLKK